MHRHLVYQFHLFGALKSDESVFQKNLLLDKFLDNVRFPKECIQELYLDLTCTKTPCTEFTIWYDAKCVLDEPVTQMHKRLCPLGTADFGCDGVGESFVNETLTLLVFSMFPHGLNNILHANYNFFYSYDIHRLLECNFKSF